MTQFGQPLAELNIEILCANCSQAKGGLERKLHIAGPFVKKLWLASISDMPASNNLEPNHAGAEGLR